MVMGNATCKLLYGMLSLGLHGYMIFLTAMTVHRYRAVVHALTASSFTAYIHILCATLWLFSLIFSIPDIILLKTDHFGDNVFCRQSYKWIFGNYLQVMFFLLSFAVIMFCYLCIWIRIRQCRITKKHQPIKLIFLNVHVRVVGFVICWALYNIFLFLLSLNFQVQFIRLNNTVAYQFAHVTSDILIYLHCGLSPLIYIFGAENFRKHLPLCRSVKCFLVGERA